MTAIRTKFNVDMTDDQRKQIRAEWDKHGINGSCVLMAQPIGVNGALPLTNPYFNFAILTPECSYEIQDVLRKHAALSSPNKPDEERPAGRNS